MIMEIEWKGVGYQVIEWTVKLSFVLVNPVSLKSVTYDPVTQTEFR